MTIDKENLAQLQAEYGEAFYILDTKQFKSNFIELRNTFRNVYPYFNIAYSYKTNYTPALCKIVNELGGYAEVVSEMELEIAKCIGVEPRNIIWNGPIKNPQVLKDFLLNGGVCNIDNSEELEVIKTIAEKNPDTTLNIGLRCNYNVYDGVISRFGFDVDSDDFKNAIDYIKRAENIHFKNFHCHFAKRQIEYWPARAKGILSLLDRLGIIPERIDIGGGLFGKMDDSLKAQFSSAIPSYLDYAEASARYFTEYFQDKEIKPELVIEPGSALVGDCMKFLATVKSIKNVRGKWFASVLGSQKNISMGEINPPMQVVHMGNKAKKYSNMDIVGFTCIEGDVIYHGYTGPLAVGDVIIVGNCGSYSIVMKPPFILPNFAVIDISGNNVKLIKAAETFNDIFHTFVF